MKQMHSSAKQKTEFSFSELLSFFQIPGSSLVVGSGVHLVPWAPVVVEIAKRRCPRWLSRAVVVEMLDHLYPTAVWSQSLVAVLGCRFWLQSLVAVFGCSLWLQFLVAVFGCSLWLQSLVSGYKERFRKPARNWNIVLSWMMCFGGLVSSRWYHPDQKNEIYNFRAVANRQISKKLELLMI